MTTVVIVDDQPMIRAGLRSILETAECDVIGEASDGASAMTLLARVLPEVVLMDLRMPGVDGVEATRLIRADPRMSGVRVLVLTTFDGDHDVLTALSAGADGFLSKSAEPDALIAAVQQTAAGESSLSPRAARAVVSHLAKVPVLPPDPGLTHRLKSLTPRERDLVIAAASGEDNDTIGRQLFISPLTVKTHLHRAMLKLGARDRAQLVAMAHRLGLAP